MDKGEYLKMVLEQIRYRKIRSSIGKELENHIEDQKSEFMKQGLSEREALQKAIEDMGDPVETGIALDHVHRPKMEWGFMVLVLGLSMLGLLLQYSMKLQMGSEAYPYNFTGQFWNMAGGIVIMLFFCFFDYTRIGLSGKYGAFAILLLLLYSLVSGPVFQGQAGYLTLFRTISMHQGIYLYIPFFGGILYNYRNQGKKGLLKSVCWMLLPVFMVFWFPSLSLAGSLTVIMLVQIYAACRKGWFRATRRGAAAVAAFTIAFPVLLLSCYMFFGQEYQKVRIKTWLGIVGPGEQGYLQALARNIIKGSNWTGRSLAGIEKMMPQVPSDFILTYIFSYYGILAAVALMAVLGIFLFKMFHVSIRQKNQLGNIIGLGCSLVFAVQIILYFLVNLTLLPVTAVYLPLFTYGGTGTAVTYALIGILLSIYRYQNVCDVTP